MSMHLVGPYLTTTRYSSKQKKSKSQRLELATAKHNQWLVSRGIHPDQLKNAGVDKHAGNHIPNYRMDNNPIKLSNNLHIVGGFKKDVISNMHKESTEVQQAILEKARRIAPAYSKGGYQYITPEQDLTDLGRKK